MEIKQHKIFYKNGRAFVWQKEAKKNIAKGRKLCRKYGVINKCFNCNIDYFITDYNKKRNKGSFDLCPYCFSRQHQIDIISKRVNRLMKELDIRRTINK